jgi:hypothetical protein
MGGGKRDIRYQTPGREAIFERFQVQTGVRRKSQRTRGHAGSSALGNQEAVPVSTEDNHLLSRVKEILRKDKKSYT